jgi:hypothetical protein
LYLKKNILYRSLSDGALYAPFNNITLKIEANQIEANQIDNDVGEANWWRRGRCEEQQKYVVGRCVRLSVCGALRVRVNAHRGTTGMMTHEEKLARGRAILAAQALLTIFACRT